MSDSDKEISGTAARQGVRKRMLPVLIVSTLLAFVLLAIIYVFFWPWPDTNTGSVSEPTTSRSAPEGVPPAAPGGAPTQAPAQ